MRGTSWYQCEFGVVSPPPLRVAFIAPGISEMSFKPYLGLSVLTGGVGKRSLTLISKA